MAGEGGGDVGAELEAPVRALAVGSGQVGRDRLADEIVELGVGEDRTGAADSAWTAAAIASDSGAPRSAPRRSGPRPSSAAIRPRFSSRRAAISSPALAKRQEAEREPLGDVGARHQPASVGRSCVATQATDIGG